MGYSSWSNSDYKNVSSSYTSTDSINDIFENTKKSKISDLMDPKNIKVRESRDSTNHPNSFASILALDVTGSMGSIPRQIVTEKLGAIMDVLVNTGFPDIQVLFAAIGDHKVDRFPIQIGQFETAAQPLNRWLTEMNIEGGGGGSCAESYLLAWYFAAYYTSIDCFEKRKRKGLLFTVGDERSHKTLSSNHITEIFGNNKNTAQVFSDKDLIEKASESYNLFHIHVNTTSYKNDPEVLNYWKGLEIEKDEDKRQPGVKLIILNNSHLVAETVAAIIGIKNGIEKDIILQQFPEDVRDTLNEALANVDDDEVIDSSISSLF